MLKITRLPEEMQEFFAVAAEGLTFSLSRPAGSGASLVSLWGHSYLARAAGGFVHARSAS